jgi:hypothetical protein
MAPIAQLSERLETPYIVYHYSLGDYVDAQRNTTYCQWASGFLSVTLPQKIDYYKWKDRQQEWLASQSTVTGLAQPQVYTVWTYLPWMSHELFHVYSLQIGRPTTFFSEGIAVAYQVDPSANDYIAREKDGTPVHIVAKNLKTAARLIPFTTCVTSAGWSSSDYTVTYDEAGSFVRYMIDMYGIAKMKQVFTSIRDSDSVATVSTKLQAIYGCTLSQAETEWLGFLDAQ